MTNILICIGGLLLILLVAEILRRTKVLKGENLRKSVHIPSACFIASWPWLISWNAIIAINLLGLAVVIAERYLHRTHFGGGIKRKTYGAIFYPIAAILCAALMQNDVFFAIAILHMGLADGLAAVVGSNYKKRFHYKIIGYRKTAIGSMTFWLTSLLIFGVGLMFASDSLTYQQYIVAVIAFPPILTAIENVSVGGIDNLTVPLATIGLLSLFN